MANRKLLSKRECDFIERHIPCMGVISNKWAGSKSQRHAFIDNMNKTQMCCIKFALNKFLGGGVNVDEGTLKKLKKYRKEIYGLVSPKMEMKEKKNILKQKGGAIISTLVGTLVPMLVGATADGIKKAIDNKKKKKAAKQAKKAAENQQNKINIIHHSNKNPAQFKYGSRK